MFKVEPAQAEDVSFVKEIEIESRLGSWSETDYLQEINLCRESLFFVVKDNSKVIGFIVARLIMLNSIFSIENEIEIYNIAVKKDFRRAGIGSKLLRKIIEIGETKHTKRIHLEVRKLDIKVQNFYEKHGFRVTGERKNFYVNPIENAILMCRYKTTD